MPQTIAYATKTEEGDYLAATDAEVTDLIAEFEAASAALEAFDAANPVPAYVFRNSVSSEEYEVYAAASSAHDALRKPLEQVKAAANKALSASRNLPIGTVVRFATSEGWYDSTSDEGMIVKVTPTSYVVDKSRAYGSSGTARLNREHAHNYRSSYGGSKGERSLSIVRTVAQQREHMIAESAARQQRESERSAQMAHHDAYRAAEAAQEAQARIAGQARRNALEILTQRHRAEYEALVATAMDMLALDAPGREASTLPAPLKTA